MIKKLTITGLIFVALNGFSQEFLDWGPWQNNDAQNKKSFQQAVEEFNAYWKDKDINQKGNGYKIFKRWEYYWKDQLNEDGTMPGPRDLLNEAYRIRNQRNETGYRNGGFWKCIGPYTHKNNGSWSAGQGRINVFIEDPNTPTTLYAGAPNGGLWKSVDDGKSWKPMSDFLGYIGVSAIAVSKKEGDKEPIIYIATGDDDGGNSPGIGVWKSEDGGETWSETGSGTSVPGNGTDIYVDPKNNNNLWVGTSKGAYYSTDAAKTWKKSSGISMVKDLKLKPGDANTVYVATKSEIYKSTDAGKSFSQIHSFSGNGRIVLDVTPAEPNSIFCLRANGSKNGGIWKSTDGNSFTQVGMGPGFDSGQAGYDLAFAVSDKDPKVFYRGCMNVYRSTNGGSTITKLNNWSSPNQPTYTHADIHFIRIINGRVFVGSDGGAYRSIDDGKSFQDLTKNGIATGQFYKLSGHPDDPKILVGGLQDNGGYFRWNGVWNNFYGADGMDAAVQGNDPTVVYGFIQSGGGPYKSVNGGAGRAVSKLPSGGKWITPLMSDKNGNLYAGGTNMYKYNPSANSWTKLGNQSFTGRLDEIEVSPSNNQTIYAVAGKTFYASTNGGSSWTTSQLPGGVTITSIEVDEKDSKLVWASAKGKAFKSTDGGKQWTDMSQGLPDIRTDIIKKVIGDGEKLYLGNVLGVWYRDKSMDKWMEYSNRLPNVTVTDLEINEKEGVIRASTYGRGVWESPLGTLTGVDNDNTAEINNLNAFPNPTDGGINISFYANDLNNYKLEIRNTLGQVVFKENLDSYIGQYNKLIEIDGPNGVYFVTVQSANRSEVSKFIKQ